MELASVLNFRIISDQILHPGISHYCVKVNNERSYKLEVKHCIVATCRARSGQS